MFIAVCNKEMWFNGLFIEKYVHYCMYNNYIHDMHRPRVSADRLSFPKGQSN